ncbi:MAG: glycosyltransferase [Acidobacteria bacterium]|nr:glycosyltransferase [Acidobacteriota bacterium]
MDLSVVIPVYNEAENLEALCREFTETLGAWGRPFEVILVDDGSTDGSFETLRRLQGADPRLRVIQFRRNFGQTAAFAAGFAYARGRLIATADGDLQNDPRDLPAMVERLEAGEFDIVCGWRKDRKDTFINRRLPSILANRLISWATGVKLNDYGCSLKVFRAEVVKPLKLYGEMHRFLPALASEMGVRIAEHVVNHRARQFGRTKYGISRTVRVVLDLVTVKFLLSYSTRPLQMFGLLGVLMGLAGGVLLAFLGYMRLTRGWSADGPILLLGVLLVFTGVQLLTIGLLAELQARTYHESQGKPIYVVRQVIEDTDPAGTSAPRSTRSV